MVIRDDRRSAKRIDQDRMGSSIIPKDTTKRDNPAYFAPDAVLYSCPDCGRSHFVTVDDCPDAATAAAETAMVGRKAA